MIIYIYMHIYYTKNISGIHEGWGYRLHVRSVKQCTLLEVRPLLRLLLMGRMCILGRGGHRVYVGFVGMLGVVVSRISRLVMGLW